MQVLTKHSESIVPVLRYRHITPNGGEFNCHPKNFYEQMLYLVSRGFTTLSAKQFAHFMRGEPLPYKSVLVTFDGGYLDNYVFAFPTLIKLGVHASIFLSTSVIRDGEARANLNSSEILPYCPAHDECKIRINQGHPETVMMNWDEIRLMRSSGLIDFHSFAHTQTRWDQQVNEEGKNLAMKKELAQSREILQTELGEVSEHLCWPHGYFDEDYIALAQEAGFQLLYTSNIPGFNYAKGTLSRIYRVDAPNSGATTLAYRLLLARKPWFASLASLWDKQKGLEKPSK